MDSLQNKNEGSCGKKKRKVYKIAYCFILIPNFHEEVLFL